jgi:hypothetical protein
MRCAIDAEDENKEIGTVGLLDLSQTYLDTSVLAHVFLLILFHSIFVIPVVPRTTRWTPLFYIWLMLLGARKVSLAGDAVEFTSIPL